MCNRSKMVPENSLKTLCTTSVFTVNGRKNRKIEKNVYHMQNLTMT